MSMLLEVPNISKRKLDEVKTYVQTIIESATSPLYKELGVLVIKALDYNPIDVKLSQLDYFRSHYSNDLEKTIDLILAKNEPMEEETLFWFAFYLYAMQFEATTLKSTFSPEELELGSFLETNFALFPSDIQQRIRYISYKLGADIAKQRISQHTKHEMAGLQSEFTSVKGAVERIDGWENRLTQWETRITNQESRLKDQLVKLNFVGLSRAFQNLVKEKMRERSVHACISVFLGIVFIVVSVAIIYWYLFTATDKAKLPDWHVLVPVIAFEFALLYFFRVALQNYASAKAQLLQVRLRLELCAFIEGYAEFIEPIRDKSGAETLAKFESIVFSGISPDPQNVPSQFDGIENILNILKTMKGEK